MADKCHFLINSENKSLLKFHAMSLTQSQPLAPDLSIQKFLESQSVFTLATSINNTPYCASCFYAYIAELQLLVFKSDEDTKHIEDALQNSIVAGTVLADKLDKTKIRGVQFTGLFKLPDSSIKNKAENAYLLKYPVSALYRGTIWLIELSKIKFTDNTLIFGKKIMWER